MYFLCKWGHVLRGLTSFKSPTAEVEVRTSRTSPSVKCSNKSSDFIKKGLLPVAVRVAINKCSALQSQRWMCCRSSPVTGSGCRLVNIPSGNTILSGALPKTERPKSLDLSGGLETLRFPVPHVGSVKQLHLTADRLRGVKEEEAETEKPVVERSRSCSKAVESPGVAVTVKRTGVETGFDPLSLMASDSLPECEEEKCSTPTTPRNLATEIETYMNNRSSPLNRHSPADVQEPCSPLFQSSSSPQSSHRPTPLQRTSTQISLPLKSQEKLRSSMSLPLGACIKDRERPSSFVSPSSPTPSNSSFSMDSLFTPTLDIFKSSVISAGKGVAEKASRLYSRLSSQTSLTQVRSQHTFFYMKTHLLITESDWNYG